MVDDAFISRPGSANNDFTPEQDASSLFLKLFINEVLVAFDEYNVMKPHMMRREAPRGAKSAQFLVTGRAKANGLLPGATGIITNLWQDQMVNATGVGYNNQIKSNEKEVFLDGPIIAATAITEFDELRAQYDVRAGHAAELGKGVAEEFDIRSLLMVANGARSASLISIASDVINNDRSGRRFLDADFNSNGASAASTLFQLKRLFDARFVPALGRHVAITPECMSNLAQQTDLLNRDWIQGVNGDFADGSVYKVAGFQLHVTARLRSADNTAGLSAEQSGAGNRVGALNIYGGSTAPANANGGAAVAAGAYADTVALAWHESGIGYVDRLGLTLESDYDIGYQSTLMVAKKLCGISWLRPEACIEVTDL